MSFEDSSDSGIDSEGEKDVDMEDDVPIGPSLFDFYHVGKEIGKGAFSIVKEGMHKQSGQKVAIKSIKARYIKNKLLIREIDIMKRVGNHPNILNLYEVYETKNYFFLVLELVTGGELFDHIVARGEYSEFDASRIVRQVISAVAHLHNSGIAHRDLKPQNLLCVGTGEEIRVADFGLSKMFDQGEYLETCCGSPEYVAPEVLECKPYDKSCDLWSVGIITYVLLTGCFPFWDKNNVVLYEKIRRSEYGWPAGSVISPEAKDLISHLIERNPEKRYNAEQALMHPWVSGEGVSNDKRLISSVPSRKK